MIWLLAGYMFLFIHRPFEVWPVLGEYRLERVYMLATIVVWFIGGGSKSLVPGRMNRAFGLLISVILMSWVLSPFPSVDSQKVVENYLKVGVFYVLLMTTIKDETALKKMIALYVGAVAVYLSHSFYEFLCGRHVYRMGIARLIGIGTTHADPNTFAATICYSLPMVLPFWKRAYDRKQQILVLAFVGLSVLCVLLTGSRSGLVLLGILAFFLLLTTKRRKIWITVFALSMPLVWVKLPEDLRNRFWTLVDPSVGPANAKVSAEGRRKGWQDGVRIWTQYPILGAGPGAFMAARGERVRSHQLYGQVLGELGTAGAIALALIVWGFVRNFLDGRAFSKACDGQWSCFSLDVSQAVLMTIGLLLIGGLAGHNLYRYTWLWFGGFQSIALYCVRENLVNWIPTARPRVVGWESPILNAGVGETPRQYT